MSPWILLSVLPCPLAVVDTMDVALFGILILVFVLILFGICIWGIWLTRRQDSLSPYSRLPMRLGSDLSYDSSERVLRYLYNLHQYDNRIFNLRRAAVCRETGRIFPDALTWYNKIKVDWTFLQKRYPGKYVSWGSLTTEQQESVLNVHDTVEGFETGFSAPQPQPKAIEAKYAFSTPGPLYVDLETKVLLGWKQVPGTDLEVLIVQKPVHQIHLSIT